MMRSDRAWRHFYLIFLLLCTCPAWSALSCTFDAKGQLVALPAPSSANVSASQSWGGIGGTGSKHLGPQSVLVENDSVNDPKGWGGIGGTGVTPAGQTPLAGYVLFAQGTVLAQQGHLPVRKLAKGDAVCEGDALITPARDGMLQIHMADQGQVMLYAGSKLYINTFNLPPKIDGSERLAMTLEDGGMRAMTGEIGHVNKENYLIQTPRAQIHIRGTDHEVFYVPVASGRFRGVVPGTYNYVISGGTTMFNAEGSVRLDPAQSGFVPLTTGLPKTISILPEALRALPAGRETAARKVATGDTDTAASDWETRAVFPWEDTPLSVIQKMHGSITYLFDPVNPAAGHVNGGGKINSLQVGVTFGAHPTVDSYAVNVRDAQNHVWNASSDQAVSLSDFKRGQMGLQGSCAGCQSSTAVTGMAGGKLIGPQADGLETHFDLQTPNHRESVSGAAVLKH